MTLARTLFVLVSAALLEVGGDALIRRGLHQRPLLFLLLGGILLFAYGVLVNQGGVPFGRLLGSYIAVFFVVSQMIAVLVFRDTLGWQTLAGGTLIVAGGIVLLL
jgi:small multidrug resistance family-3 protein